MRKFRFAFNILAITVFSLAISSVAQAQATRTWVSGVGDDANPCSRTAPCKTFAGAISKTAACGEISVLDPGGFGAVTITKSITINGDGTLAGILAANVNGIIVNAGVNDVVTIRNVSINGACTALNGIRYLAGKHLRVENCTIYGFTGASSAGIDGANTVAGEMSIVNTSISNCTTGIRTANIAGNNNASISNCRVQRGTTGIQSRGSGNVTVSDSVISHQTGNGLLADNSATLNAERCVASNNGTGANAFTATSTLRISGCSFFNNATGVNVAAGSTSDTFQNNSIFGNTTANVTGTLQPRVQQ
ncbi:MAG: right-handed parallel beta-helix repeat-containing protein [Acidobacteriota bacterium]